MIFSSRNDLLEFSKPVLCRAKFPGFPVFISPRFFCRLFFLQLLTWKISLVTMEPTILNRLSKQSARLLVPASKQRSSEVNRGQQRLPEVIRGHQRLIDIIRSHQRSTEINRDHKRLIEVTRLKEVRRLTEFIRD